MTTWKPAAVALLVAAVPYTPRAAAPEVYRIDLRVDAAVSGAALLVAVVPEVLGSRVVARSCPCDRGDVPGFDRVALDRRSGTAAGASDITLALALAVPPLLDALALGDGPAVRQDAVIYFETLGVAASLAQIAKYAVQRPRPRSYSGDPAFVGLSDGYLSFYSGHTTLTFAALSAASMTARYRYGEQVWPWLVTAAIGTSVAVERVAAGRHFPSDVVAGALAGIGVGVAVPWLHRRGPASSGLALVPNPGAPGLALTYRP